MGGISPYPQPVQGKKSAFIVEFTGFKRVNGLGAEPLDDILNAESFRRLP